MRKYVCIVLIFLNGIIYSFAQTEDYIKVDSLSTEDYIKVKPLITELGIGYPRSFAGKTTYLDMFFNLGYQRSIGEKFFAGILFAPQYRQNATADLNISSKLRLGGLVSKNENVSFDVGYSLYSRRYKKLPGLAFGFNYNKTNTYGIHVKYEEYNVDMPSHDRTLVFGVHLSGNNTTSKGLPMIGTVLGVLALFLLSI